MVPVTPQGQAVSSLFNLALWLSLGVFLLVAGVLAYVVLRFRARVEADDEPAQVEGNRRVEVIWTVTPLVLIAVLFALAVRTLDTLGAASPSPLRIRVVGHQWWWEYEYPDLGVRSANELRVPTGTPLQLEITSADVIHSYDVRAFGWKSDAIPGKVNLIRLEVAKAGRYDGDCTEYCGAQHAWMRVDMLAEPREQFDGWVLGQLAPAAEPSDAAARRGKAVFLGSTCVNCHTVRGVGPQPRVGPELTHLGSRPTIGAGIRPNTRADLRDWLRDVQAVKPGALMPSYADLAETDLDALAAYLESLK
ncbi:MAG TPA: cytochrome c oxidase subunit II [Chloroflexota bacterium]